MKYCTFAPLKISPGFFLPENSIHLNYRIMDEGPYPSYSKITVLTIL